MPHSPTPSECSTATNEPFTECVTASEGTTVTTALLAFDNCWTAMSLIENDSPQTAQSIQNRHSAESILKCISASVSTPPASNLDTTSDRTTLKTAVSTSVSSDSSSSIQLNKNPDDSSKSRTRETTSWASSLKTSYWSNWTQSGSSASSMSLENNEECSRQSIPQISVSSVVQSKNGSDYK